MFCFGVVFGVVEVYFVGNGGIVYIVECLYVGGRNEGWIGKDFGLGIEKCYGVVLGIEVVVRN